MDRCNAIKKKLANPHPTPAAGCRSSSLSRDPSSPADGCSTATPPSPDWRDLMSLALPPLPPRPPPDRGSRPSTTRPRAASPPSGFGGTVLQPAPEIRPRPPQPPPPTQPHAEQQLVTLSPQKVAKMVAGEASRSSILFGPPSFYRRRRRLPLATVAGIGRWAPTGCSFRWLWHRNPIGPKLPWVVLLATIDMRVPIIVSHPRCQLTTPLAPKFPPSVHSVGAVEDSGSPFPTPTHPVVVVAAPACCIAMHSPGMLSGYVGLKSWGREAYFLHVNAPSHTSEKWLRSCVEQLD